jgi:hypothetical protein
LNLAKSFLAGPGVLPNRLSNNPIVPSLVRDMFREPLYYAVGTDGYFPAFGPISTRRRMASMRPGEATLSREPGVPRRLELCERLFDAMEMRDAAGS